MIIKGNSEGINYICQLDNGKLVSSSFDKSIRIWSLFQTSYQCDCIINKAHIGLIRQVISLSNNRIASCSDDKSIKIWNSDTKNDNLINTLDGHIRSVKSIIRLKGTEVVISGSDDNTLRIWNMISYQCETIINNVSCCWNHSINQIDNNRLVIGADNLILMVNITRKTIEYKTEIGSVLSLTILRDGNVLCGCEDGILCHYNTKLNNVTYQKTKAHNDSISGLLSLNEHQFISSSYDKTIKLWEY